MYIAENTYTNRVLDHSLQNEILRNKVKRTLGTTNIPKLFYFSALHYSMDNKKRRECYEFSK